MAPDTPVRDILEESKLTELKRGFAAGREKFGAKLQKTLPNRYEPSALYVNAILGIFYKQENLPKDDDPPPRFALSARDRERCIIALLAARGGGFNLALHIYSALMIDISPEEIANILLLAGVYTGVDNFSEAIEVEAKTLELLQGGSSDVEEIFSALRAEFPD